MFKGIIFDFNGTLYDDTDLQEAAWDVIIKKYLHRPLGPTEFRDCFHGLTNAEIALFLNKTNPGHTFTLEITDEKEATYREICREQKERVHFVKGVVELFETLKAHNIPFTVATASEITNVRFYYEAFDLAKWISFDEIVYDDLSYPGKPAPDIFLKAAKKLGVPIEQCIVCEDSLNGILAAEAANAGRIIAHAPALNADVIRNDPRVYAIIDNYIGFFEKYM